MIIVLLLWGLIFFIFYLIGYFAVKIINSISKQDDEGDKICFDEYFFIGFLILSAITGLLSISFPIGRIVLYIVSFLAILIFLINYKKIKANILLTISPFSHFSKFELPILLFIIIFILTAVVQGISFYDVGLYHAQCIQWIQKYAVVPGLGNLHARFAFNSMFFVISGPFTFQIKDILIFPVNGVCYLVLIFKLITLYKKENNPGTKWKAVFYALTLLISLLIMIPNLNSPSPDIICSVLIIYTFIMILDLSEKGTQLKLVQIILLNLAVFSCVAFKISSIFLIASLLFLWNKDIIRRSMITIVIGILVLSSFVIRNYYLSGYVIYPFPAIDIFNVDWKIPLDNVRSVKLEIEGFAKIWNSPYPDVVNMKISEWIFPWFKLLNFNGKMLVTINFFSIVSFIIMLFKKDFLLAKIQLIVLINLFFWIVMAPDLRFAYGFIFIGFSLTFAYLIKLLENSSFSGILRYIKLSLGCFLFLIICRRITFPVSTFIKPSLWVLPAAFESVETNSYGTSFSYLVPVNTDQCFNSEIPCVPYPLENIVIRGTKLQEGFKLVKQNP